MVQIVKCKNCNKGGYTEFGETTVTVNYNKTVRCCDHCNNTKTETKYEFFCSEKCFREYYKICQDNIKPDKDVKITKYTDMGYDPSETG